MARKRHYKSPKTVGIIIIIGIIIFGFFLFYDRSTGKITLPGSRPSVCLTDSDCPRGQNCAMESQTCITPLNVGMMNDGQCPVNSPFDPDCPVYCAPSREGFSKICCVDEGGEYTIDCSTKKPTSPENFKNWPATAKMDLATLQALVTFGPVVKPTIGNWNTTQSKSMVTNVAGLTAPSAASFTSSIGAINQVSVWFETITVSPAWANYTQSITNTGGSVVPTCTRLATGDATPTTGCIGRKNNATILPSGQLIISAQNIGLNTMTTGTTYVLPYNICYTYHDSLDVYVTAKCSTFSYNIRSESGTISFTLDANI